MMKEYNKLKLWEVCLHKPLFKEELENIVSQSKQHELFEVLNYCYDKYSDMHTEILLEIFSRYGKNGNTAKTVEVENMSV